MTFSGGRRSNAALPPVSLDASFVMVPSGLTRETSNETASATAFDRLMVFPSTVVFPLSAAPPSMIDMGPTSTVPSTVYSVEPFSMRMLPASSSS